VDTLSGAGGPLKRKSILAGAPTKCSLAFGTATTPDINSEVTMSGNRLGSDTYRDDRMYVMRVTSNFTSDTDGAVTVPMHVQGGIDLSKPVVLITYLNTPDLPAVRVDDFPSGREAIDYIMRVEPTCPRVSLGGRPPEPTPTWRDHLELLHAQGLASAAEGDAPVPHWVEGKNNPRETFMLAPKK
jgi:hypothetical protein